MRVPGYEFDVFISYSRRGSAPKWLMNHFYPKLKECLADQIAPAPTVFLDKQMERGVSWPDRLDKALRRSKILGAVLNRYRSLQTGLGKRYRYYEAYGAEESEPRAAGKAGAA